MGKFNIYNSDESFLSAYDFDRVVSGATPIRVILEIFKYYGFKYEVSTEHMVDAMGYPDNASRLIGHKLWSNENLQEDYTYLSSIFIFKNEEDAMAFKLRWL